MMVWVGSFCGGACCWPVVDVGLIHPCNRLSLGSRFQRLWYTISWIGGDEATFLSSPIGMRILFKPPFCPSLAILARISF